jgi:hypothetical protein
VDHERLSGGKAEFAADGLSLHNCDPTKVLQLLHGRNVGKFTGEKLITVKWIYNTWIERERELACFCYTAFITDQQVNN